MGVRETGVKGATKIYGSNKNKTTTCWWWRTLLNGRYTNITDEDDDSEDNIVFGGVYRWLRGV